MGYAVLHLNKGSGSGGGLGSHIDRTPGYEHSYENANPELRNKNINFTPNKYTKMDFSDAVNSRIEDGYKSNRKIRTDAVKFCSAILTGSHEEMIRISKDKKKFDEWIKANYKFAAEKWGAENIVRFSLHMDEKTPHIHCAFVPITANGKLSAKEVMGNRVSLRNLQDNYAIKMEVFDLKRGLRGSKAKHETVQEYHGRAERAVNPSVDKIELYSKNITKAIGKPSRMDILKPDKYLQKTQKTVKTALNEALKDNSKHLNSLENENRKLRKELGKVQGHLNRMQKNFGNINETKFELKINQDQILFSSEGEVVPVKKEDITNALDERKFVKNINTVKQKIQRDIINVKFQKAIKNNDLLSIAPNQIKTIAAQILNDVLNHDDTNDYVVNGQKVNISYHFSHNKEDQQLLLHLSYFNLKNKLKEEKRSSNINEIYRDLMESLRQQQIKQSRLLDNEPGINRKKGKGL